MDLAGRELRRRAARNRPGAALVLADGEERDVAEQIVAGADHAIEPRFGQAEIGQKGGGVGGVELRDLELDLRADRDGGRSGARKKRRQPGGFRRAVDVASPHLRLRELRFVEIDHDEQRLGGEKLEAAQPLEIVAFQIERAQRLAVLERRLAQR